MGGAVATTVLEGDRQFGLQVRLLPEYRNSIDAVRNVKVGYATSSGVNAYIPLSELATISLDTGASFIYRDRSQRYVPIKFSVRGRDLGGTVAEAQERVAKKDQTTDGLPNSLGRRIREFARREEAAAGRRSRHPSF